MKKLALLIFGIFLIASVSAINSGCCEMTIGSDTAKGAWCQEAPADCNPAYRTSSNSCEDAFNDGCKPGSCFDYSDGTCSFESPKLLCEAEGGEWESTDSSNCEQGCCGLGTKTDFMTQRACELESGIMDWTVPEENCRFLSQDYGACVYEGEFEETCHAVSEVECETSIQGDFNLGVFCSDPVLEMDYEADKHTICVGNKVYNADENYNREGLNETCIEGESKCVVENGEASCKDLRCYDEENDKQRLHSESWCVYDGTVGVVTGGKTISRDAPGSEHCKLYCNEGEITLDECSEQRTTICTEKNKSDGTTEAKMRTNLGYKCFGIDNAEECKKNVDCRVHSVDLLDYIEGVTYGSGTDHVRFDVCVPKYPEGKSEKEICSLASFTCVMNEAKEAFGGYECRENCNCRSKLFLKQMNDFCVSLGDCGGYVNTENVYTKNFGISGHSWPDPDDRDKTDLSYRYNFLFPNTYDNIPEWLRNVRRSGGYGENFVKFNNEYQDAGEYGDWINPDRLEEIRFTCQPWKPKIGGDDCSACNEYPLIPCTPYRCENLGRSCGILEETLNTDNPICYNIYDYETEAPDITFGGVEGKKYKFVEGIIPNTVFRGVSVSDCITEYSVINFSVKTDEPAICVWDYTRRDYEEMNENFEEKEPYNKVHSINDFLIETIDEDEHIKVYIKCQDPNENEEEYVVDFCIAPEEDTMAPRITETIPSNGSFLKMGTTNISFKVYTHEPAICGYSKTPGKTYEDMDLMSCNNNQEGPTKRYCSANIVGFTEKQNNIYVKCRDEEGNTNDRDKVFSFLETETELSIISTSPKEGDIRKNQITSSSPLYFEATTSGGAYGGKSKCKYIFTDCATCWDYFPEEDSVTHKYKITGLEEGAKSIKITCEDKAGNTAEKVINFNVDIDITPPKVIRAFKKESQLNIITDEIAECYYSSDKKSLCDFNIKNGTSMETGLTKIHTADWNPSKTYYIKCLDIWENPNLNCAMIVKPI